MEYPKGKAADFYSFEKLARIKICCFGLAIFFADDEKGTPIFLLLSSYWIV
jgi:hypothetical protein